MELKPQAQAIAQLDAICDEYAAAVQAGDTSVSDDPQSLEAWVSRVAPDLQSWLRDELWALRDELAPHDPAKSVPDSIDLQSWEAVDGSETFRQLSREAKTALAKSLLPRVFADGDRLLQSGETASGLFLITAGNVRVLGGDRGEHYEIDTDGAGAVLGEMSMLTGYPCSADVVALTPIQALELPLEAFHALRDSHPEIEIALSQLVSDRLGHRRRDALCGKSFGGYRLRHCLGIGAMGVVYAAQHESDGAERAVKMLRHRFIYDQRVVSRFDREAELLQRLHHPNIVAFYEHFVAYRTRFIVLERFDGADLRTVIQRRGGLGEALARAVLGQIASGLQYAHRHGVLHLDLKPANILIDRAGRIAITDFGLSRLIVSDGGDHDCVGTPLYMPPEQFLMTDIGPHSDWYSLGCIGYELASGERLFDSEASAGFLDDKLAGQSAGWPAIDVGQAYRDLLWSALQPMVEDRRMNLDEIAGWARAVPELAADFVDDTQADCEVT